MSFQRLGLLLVAAILLSTFIASPALSATSASLAISPLSVVTSYGSTNGSLSALGALDQSGTDDTPASYVAFQTPSTTPYLGYSSFQLPPQVRPDLISSSLLQINFNGPPHTQQVWSWAIYNWTTGQWNKVGDTIGVNPNTWDTLLFRITAFTRYVSPSREISIQLTSNNTNGDAKVDYLALHFTYLPITPTKTPITATVLGTKPAVTYAITYTPTLTFTPTNTPTRTNTPTPTSTRTATPTRTPTSAPVIMPVINLSNFKSGFSSPVFITHANDGTNRIFVVERCGRVKIIDNTGAVLATPFLDLTNTAVTDFNCSGSEQGLLSIAFPPNYSSKNYFYAAYTVSNGTLRVSRFHVNPGTPNQATTTGLNVIINIPHPNASNHNGGQLAFGNDGYLYISTGDGGNGNDPDNNAQNTNALLGKILRIDVESGALTYNIPATNPFVGASGLDEIWAYGLRNPWRFSFDRQSHDLFIADVGQGAWEEVDVQPAAGTGGDNYGWSCYEGKHSNPNTSETNCQPQNFYKAPVVEYSHSLGCSITGGYIYRGSEFPSLQGIYLYGDYCSGRIWGMKKVSGQWQSQMLLDSDQSISSFGEDEAGNIYLAGLGSGNIYKVEVPTAAAPTIAGCPMFPANNIWNARVDSLPIHARSAQWINSIGSGIGFHMDFGSGIWPPSTGGPIGIPYNTVVGSSVTNYTVDFYYPSQSDTGPYPIPASPNIEFGGDHHILVVDTETCTLYETFDMSFSGGQWSGGSGAIWSLNSNTLRPDTWTSADAAGLPILPGLVRYEEVAAGQINHALRFTVEQTNSYIWPARHLTSGTAGVLTNVPPMGARFRLKASYDISGFSPEMQVILLAMKQYGIILADNGSNWYVSGVPSESWDNDMLHTLDVLKGSDFEAVDTSSLIVNFDSGQAAP